MFYYENNDGTKVGPFENSEFNKFVKNGTIIKTTKIFNGEKVILAGDVKNIEWPEIVDVPNSETKQVIDDENENMPSLKDTFIGISVFIGIVLFFALSSICLMGDSILGKYGIYIFIGLFTGAVSIAITVYLFKILLDIRKALHDIRDTISKR